MLGPINPKHVLNIVILIAIRDGAERVSIRTKGDNDCEMFYCIAGQTYEMVPPPFHVFQQLPAVLAVFVPAWLRLPNRIRRWIRRARQGRFEYTIGMGSVAVDYRVQWLGGQVREMEFNVSHAPELKDAASELLNPPPIKGYENIDY